MNIFKTTTFTWWQISLLKWAVLFIGIVVGSYWPEVFAPYALWFLIAGAVISVYLLFIWAKNK